MWKNITIVILALICVTSLMYGYVQKSMFNSSELFISYQNEFQAEQDSVTLHLKQMNDYLNDLNQYESGLSLNTLKFCEDNPDFRELEAWLIDHRQRSFQAIDSIRKMSPKGKPIRGENGAYGVQYVDETQIRSVLINTLLIRERDERREKLSEYAIDCK